MGIPLKSPLARRALASAALAGKSMESTFHDFPVTFSNTASTWSCETVKERTKRTLLAVLGEMEGDRACAMASPTRERLEAETALARYLRSSEAVLVERLKPRKPFLRPLHYGLG